MLRPIVVLSLFIGWLAVVPNGARGQTVQRELLEPFTLEKVTASLIPHASWAPFPRTPQAWRQHLPASMIQGLIGKGEAALDFHFEPIPATVTLEYIRTGDRDNYQSISFEKRKRLWDLVMAEAVEGKGRFLDQIMNGVWSICEESFWGVPAHIHYQKAGDGLPDVEDPIVDLFAAETGTVLALTDYLVGEALGKISALLPRRIYHEVNRRFLTPMRTADYYWLGLTTPEKKVANWAPWVTSNYMATSLLLEKDETKRAHAVAYTLEVMDHYLNSVGDGGSTEEGPSYWFAAAGSVYDGLDLLADATGGKLTIYQNPFLQKTGSYIYKMHIADRYFYNVGDADPKLLPNGLMFYRFGKAVQDPSMIRFGTWAHQTFGEQGMDHNWHRVRLLYNYMALREMNALPRVEYAGIPHAWMSDIQAMVARSSNGLYVATHGGHNAESHNHNDVGDFVIYNDGKPVVIDVGRGTYTYKMFRGDRYGIWFNNSAYHNLPTINGHVQSKGRQYEASEVRHGPGKAEVSMNIASAYPKAAGVQKWVRTVKAAEDGRISVQDVFRMAAPLESLTQSLMTVCTTSVPEPGLMRFVSPGGGAVFMRFDAAKWTVETEKMPLTAPEDQKLKSSWDGCDIWRIVLRSKASGTEGSHALVFFKP